MNFLAAVVWSGAIAAAAPSIVLPLYFEPNVGQTDLRVKYLARGQAATIWLTDRGPVFGLAKTHGLSVLQMRFEGGNRMPKIQGEDRRGGVSNYFIGREKSTWRTGVQQFAKVRYRDVYPGIDVVFYGNPERLEYDFVLAPGADPGKIRLAFEGADRVTTNAAGDLLVRMGDVELLNRKPRIYQGKNIVEGRYVTRGRRRAGFIVDRYDPAQALVIDPVLTYATYLGGSVGDQATATAVDSQGNIFVTGQTNSADFPVKAGLYPVKGTQADLLNPIVNVFLTKINPSASGGASVIFSTFYGGDHQSYGGGVAVDRNGNVYIAGTSSADNLPLRNPFQPAIAGAATCSGPTPSAPQLCSDAFVAKFSPAGDALIYASYLGGSNQDGANGIAVDAAGNAYIVGITQSLDFPIRGGPFQIALRGLQVAFLSELNSLGGLVYSSYFGGSLTTFQGVAVDAAGAVYVAGTTTSPQTQTTQGAFQSQLLGNQNAFAAKLNPSLGGSAALLYATYLGAAGGITQGNGVAFDSSGNIYVAGSTSSANFPVTAGAAKRNFSDLLNFLGPPYGDGFVTKLNPSAQGSAQLAYSTFVGGSVDDGATAVAVDPAGRITVTGLTNSFDFPVTPDAFQCCFDGVTAPGFITQYGFVTRLDPSKSGTASLLYSTLLGGTFNTVLNAIGADSTGNAVVVAGTVRSTDTPVTPSGYQQHFGGEQTTNSFFFNYGDAYVARFDFSASGPQITQVENGAGLAAISQTTLSPGLIFAIKGTGLGPATAMGAQIDPNTGLVSNSVGGVQVLVDGVIVPLTYVSASQINAIAPYELDGKVGSTIRVQVLYNGVAGNLFPALVAATAPAIFSFDDGSGPGAILNMDLSLNGPNRPATRNSIISFYATGEGQTNPPGRDGRIANDSLANLPRPTAAVSVTIGGVPATNIVYAGTVPTGVAGFFQVNVTVPSTVTPGPAVPVVLTVGSVSSPKTLTMAVQ